MSRNQDRIIKKKKSTNTSFIDYLTIDEKTQKCTDKIEVISLIHGTGHILVITKKGKQFRTKLKDLISELKTDQNKEIVKRDMTLFENVITFRYSAASNPGDSKKIDRSAEFDKIIQQAKLKILSTNQTGIMKQTNCVEVKVLIDNKKITDLNQVNLVRIFPSSHFLSKSSPLSQQQSKEKRG